jgi:hypothetical protein
MAGYILCALALHTRVNEPGRKPIGLNDRVGIDGFLLELLGEAYWDNMVDHDYARSRWHYHGVVKTMYGGQVKVRGAGSHSPADQ